VAGSKNFIYTEVVIINYVYGYNQAFCEILVGQIQREAALYQGFFLSSNVRDKNFNLFQQNRLFIGHPMVDGVGPGVEFRENFFCAGSILSPDCPAVCFGDAWDTLSGREPT